MNDIKVLCVGGTIDKIYFDAKSKYEVGSPAIGKILEQMDVGFVYQISSLMAKDSLEMSDADRAQIRQAVESAEQNAVIITHGTDTMVETAAALSDIPHKVIVLTGALAPAIFKDSDAPFNVGCALGAVQSQTPGVYIAMNGQIFDATAVRKDVENNRFVAL